MKGDFSRIRFGRDLNFNGILPQQGKVLLDSDGIAQTLLENDWHETVMRDIVGDIAGVAAAEPNSFEITAASLTGGVVTLTVGTGHIWADGLLVRLDHPPAKTVMRTATWLEPPLVPTAGNAADVAAGTMDVVFLEVWQRAVNGYEIPDALIEPALGGPDTAERLQTSCAFRLARMGAGQTCSDITFDESTRGALTASLTPLVVTTGDCPVVGAGGYSGFEHQLYRIEIADVNSGNPANFKWSRVNGGLVGRGAFDPATQEIAITANLPAITSYQQTSFYLEIEVYDPALGFSHVIAGASATLSGSTLQCTAAPTFGVYPVAAGSFFFRLWDGISPMSAFPISATPVQLENGILLQFDADGPGKYYPGDYWIFPVRAQGIANPQVLINARQPEGIVYYRVPLAEITWASGGGGFSAGTIEDCRTIVHPLSNVKGCCTYRVGDGVHGVGDFTSIQAAVNALPPEGGEICILPGRYFEHVFIVGKRDVVIHGCGWQTRVASPVNVIEVAGAAPGFAPGGINPIAAVFTIVNSAHIELRSFCVEASDTEAGILIDGTGTSITTGPNIGIAAILVQQRGVIDVTIKDMVITAATFPSILAEQVELLAIERNRVAMKNVASLWPAIFVSGREIHVEHNSVGIQTPTTIREWLPITVAADLAGATFTNASGSNPAASATATTLTFVDSLGLAFISVELPIHPGGIQIGGPSTDVYVLENEIEGGSRNGITLGSYTILDANGNDTGIWTGVIIIIDGCCVITLQPPNSTQPPGGRIVAGGILVNIHIHRNRIRNMGLCGIGPVAFFDLVTTLEIITIVGLKITSNGITRTLLRELAPLTESTKNFIGYGAICVPDVQDLEVYDNTITDWGAEPGIGCGIFVLHGEMIDISRNQIRETRDWNGILQEATGTTGARGGIVILFGTPPTLPQPVDSSLWGYTKATVVGATNAISTPVYEPGLPAVRIEHNAVRAPLNYSLAILGTGPFSIVNNHLACGGLVQSTGTPIAQTVLIMNLGTSIETINASSRPTATFSNAKGQYTGLASSRAVQNVSAGTILFTNNLCHLEATASLQKETASVLIFTPDSLIFSNNHCWLDCPRVSALMDALLIAGSLNVIGNRFQEAVGSVLLSGLTVGEVNITGQNISTYCLIALGSLLSNNNNLALVAATNQDICGELTKRLQGLLGL